MPAKQEGCLTKNYIALAPITTAQTKLLLGAAILLPYARYVVMQSKFAYGSGGTTLKVYFQTSLDGGATWFDIASHAYATTTGQKLSAVSADVAAAANVVPGSGALTDDTIVQGILGDRFRVIYTSSGTYAGGTTLSLDFCAKG
jgi:hypothetical protein